MIRSSLGNAGKETKRCPHCGWENLKPRAPKTEPVAIMSCHNPLCGRAVVVRPDIVAQWRRQGLPLPELEEEGR